MLVTNSSLIPSCLKAPARRGAWGLPPGSLSPSSRLIAMIWNRKTLNNFSLRWLLSQSCCFSSCLPNIACDQLHNFWQVATSLESVPSSGNSEGLLIVFKFPISTKMLQSAIGASAPDLLLFSCSVPTQPLRSSVGALLLNILSVSTHQYCFLPLAAFSSFFLGFWLVEFKTPIALMIHSQCISNQIGDSLCLSLSPVWKPVPSERLILGFTTCRGMWTISAASWKVLLFFISTFKAQGSRLETPLEIEKATDAFHSATQSVIEDSQILLKSTSPCPWRSALRMQPNSLCSNLGDSWGWMLGGVKYLHSSERSFHRKKRSEADTWPRQRWPWWLLPGRPA